MSALAIILTAAMAVPWDGPKMESGEIEQGLDLRGRWESSEKSSVSKDCGEWVIEDGKLLLSHNAGFGRPWDCRIVDEGGGNLKMTNDGQDYLGIYRQEGERLIICFRAAAYGGRPVDYREIWTEPECRVDSP